MTDTKKEAGNLLPMTVSEGISVNVLPNIQHEYLMTTKEVANGYGVTDYNIRMHKMQHPDELIEGKHFVLAVSIPNGDLPSALKCAHNAVFWTKRGIVRLGFFIKSDRAKLFRDWAEELVINRLERQLTLFEQPAKALPAKRNHNRLTNDRLLDIMADVCRIEDSNLRLSIASKLMKGGAL